MLKIFLFAAIFLCLSCLTSVTKAQENLTLRKKYDLGSSSYSEGLDFFNNFLWYTTKNNLYRLNLDSALDSDGDGDYDLEPDKTWILTHDHHSESSVWFDDKLINFTYEDTMDNLSNDIFSLDLNDDETYQWQYVGDGQGTTNWGSCRDRRNPGESIIYTGHYDKLLMWYDPKNGNTTQTLEVPALDDIEDLGMDLYGTVWASSFNSNLYPGLYRINPGTGEIIGTYKGPDGLGIIDGIAIYSTDILDVMYVTGKNTRFIWEYLVPGLATRGSIDNLEASTFKLHPNYPNPFTTQTSISFYTDQHQRVRVLVYDKHGRLVTEITDQQYQVGEHSVKWQGQHNAGRNVPSGEYIIRILFGKQVLTQKAVLIR